MALESVMTNHPSRQHDTIHLFDKDPSLRIGLMDLKTPICTNGFATMVNCHQNLRWQTSLETKCKHFEIIVKSRRREFT
ncbi:hypothetical protein Hanom_Chr04g00342001 [Helianthus anomalus]